MPDKVLVYPTFSKRLIDTLSERFEPLGCGTKAPAETYSADELSRIEAMVSVSAPITDAVLETLPNLKLIVCYGSGYDHIDVAAAKRRGITICNSPNVNAAAVADLAIGLMLAVMRAIAEGDRMIRAGQWTRKMPRLRPGMSGCRVGVFGMGAIGQKIAARAAAFEADVQYFSRRQVSDLPYGYHSSLESLVEWCDVLQIAVRAGPQTRHAIDAGMLRRLGPQGFLVNIARGSVVDEAALLPALKDGTIAGAGLDVFEVEPNIDPAFLELPNVVLTPHQGGDTNQAHEQMRGCIMANLGAFFAGNPVPYPIAA